MRKNRGDVVGSNGLYGRHPRNDNVGRKEMMLQILNDKPIKKFPSSRSAPFL